MKTKTEQKIDELKVVDPELWDRIQSYFQEMYPDEAPPYANRPQLIEDIIVSEVKRRAVERNMGIEFTSLPGEYGMFISVDNLDRKLFGKLPLHVDNESDLWLTAYINACDSWKPRDESEKRFIDEFSQRCVGRTFSRWECRRMMSIIMSRYRG